MVPTEALPLWIPSTYQLTAVLGVLMKVVENWIGSDSRAHGFCGVTNSVACGVPLMPVPVSGMTIWLIDELLLMTRFALYVAIALGLKVTSTVQLAPPASAPPPWPSPQLVVNGN